MGKLLITGTGRCGTHWVTECLKRAGIKATHEYAFTPVRDGANHEWVCEASWPAAVRLPVPGATVLHLTRHPLDTIASFMARDTFSGGSWGEWAMSQCLWIRAGRTDLERAALHWVLWNQSIELYANLTAKVEEITADGITALARIVDPDAPGIKALPPPAHTSEHPSLTWTDLSLSVHPEIAREVVELAERYGYR